MGHIRKMRPHSNNQASEDTYLAAQRGTSGQASALYPPSNAKEHYAHALGHRACAEVSGGTIGEAEHLAHDTGTSFVKSTAMGDNKEPRYEFYFLHIFT